MAYDNTIGSPRPESSDWNSALDAIRRLAAARRGALNEIDAEAIRNAKTATAHGASNAADQDQLKRDIAEIEKAAAALRKVEPALQAWSPEGDEPVREPKKLRSVWLLIGMIWVSTVVVTGSAIGAIVFLLG